MSKKKSFDGKLATYFIISCGISTGIAVGFLIFVKPHMKNIHIPKLHVTLPKIKLPVGQDEVKISAVRTDVVPYVDPWVIFESVWKKKNTDILVIDLRSSKDYTKNHFRGTDNVYFVGNQVRKSEREFVNSVKKVQKGKKLILLPYSGSSTSGEEAYNLLDKAGVKNVYVMKTGWNELYNLPNLWIPEGKWSEVNLQDYINN